MLTRETVNAAGIWVASVETGKLVSDPWLSRWGVSLHYHPELTEADILGMTQARAGSILSSDTYWLVSWNSLPAFLAKPMLAFSVLDGSTWAARTLQAALGVTVDGDVGLVTARMAENAAVLALDPVDGILRRLVEAQVARLQQSPRWLIDGKGWIGRCSAAAIAGAADLISSQ